MFLHPNGCSFLREGRILLPHVVLLPRRLRHSSLRVLLLELPTSIPEAEPLPVIPGFVLDLTRRAQGLAERGFPSPLYRPGAYLAINSKAVPVRGSYLAQHCPTLANEEAHVRLAPRSGPGFEVMRAGSTHRCRHGPLGRSTLKIVRPSPVAACG